MSVLASRRHASPGQPVTDADAAGRSNPFPGPRPFVTEERGLFFGRDREIRELVSLLFAQRIVLVHAPSGAGKSSLVQAGVIPLCEERGFEVLPVARVRCDASEMRPLDPTRNRYVANVIERWRAQDPSLGEAEATTLASFFDFPVELDVEGGAPRLVVFDQFEELFVLHPDRWRDRKGFFVELQEALDAHPTLRVMILLRDDYLAHLEPLVTALRDRLRIRYHLGQLDARQALQAVVQPVHRAGRTFEAGAAEELVSELLRAPVEAPEGAIYEAEHADAVQLQIVLRTLWDSLPPEANEITRAHVREHGDVDRALLNFYEQSVAAAVAAVRRLDERRVRQWFERDLITPARSRGLVYQDEKTTAGLPNEAVAVLEQRRLIRSEPRGPALWFELTHDRLIQAVLDSNRQWFDQRPRGRRNALALVACALVSFGLAVAVFGGGDGEAMAARSWQQKDGTLEVDAAEVVAFSARSGQLLSVELESMEGLTAGTVLEGPDGSNVARFREVDDGEIASFTKRLDAGGRYRLRITAENGSSGSFAVQVAVQDVDVERSMSTRTTRGSIARAGEVDVYRFSGRAGDVVRVAMRGEGDLDSLVRLAAPSGEMWLNDDSDDSGDSVLVTLLPEAGRYEMQATSADDDFPGRYEITLETVEPTELAPGTTRGRLTDASSSAVYRVRRPDAGPVLGRVTPMDAMDTFVTVYDGRGRALDAVEDLEAGAADRFTLMAEPGSPYLLVITSDDSASGERLFHVSVSLPHAVDLGGGQAPPATAPLSLDPAELGDVYRFDASENDIVLVLVSPAGGYDVAIELLDPNGDFVGGIIDDEGRGGQELLSHRVAQAGSYLAVVTATEPLDASVPYRLTLDRAGSASGVVR